MKRVEEEAEIGRSGPPSNPAGLHILLPAPFILILDCLFDLACLPRPLKACLHIEDHLYPFDHNFYATLLYLCLIVIKDGILYIFAESWTGSDSNASVNLPV